MSRPLQIGLLTHSVNPRGGVVHTLALAEALQGMGHHVTVMATARTGQRFFRDVDCDVDLAPLPDRAPADTVDMVGMRIAAFEHHLARVLHARRFDVLHAQDPLGGNALANLRERGLIDGFVRTVHHLDHFDAPQLAAWQVRGFLAASTVLCVSATWQRWLRRDHGVDAGVVVNGVDRTRYTPVAAPEDASLRSRLGIRADARVLLAVGGVEQRKNTQQLLRAFLLLRASHPELQFVVAGGASLLDHSAYARGFEALAAEHGVAIGPGQPVCVTGPLPDADMPALFRAADVLAMPSVNEGFGLVVLEALASGTPVVVSRVLPFTEYLHEDEVDWVDPHSPATIADAVSRALARHDPARVARAAQRLGERFSWAASARAHLDHYARDPSLATDAPRLVHP